MDFLGKSQAGILSVEYLRDWGMREQVPEFSPGVGGLSSINSTLSQRVRQWH